MYVFGVCQDVHLPTAKNPVHAHPLLVLAKNEKGAEWFDLLLANGHKFADPIDLSTLSYRGGRPVFYQVLLDTGRKPDPSVVEVFIKHGADVTKPWANGVLPIFAACRHSPDSVVELLLAAGADIRAVDACTPNHPPLIVLC